MKKVVVVGAGYVGLVTAACLASKGNHVIVVERSAEKIEQLLAGKIPFYEPGLPELVQKGLASKKLMFTRSLAQELANQPEVIFCCVGTPTHTDGSVYLGDVLSVVDEVAHAVNHQMVFVLKSTVPVGTNSKTVDHISRVHSKHTHNRHISVVSNPEFLREGSAVYDFMHPDRVVLGASDDFARDVMTALYTPFIHSIEEQILYMNPESAELTKYAANTMLAARISFMNELSQLAEAVGADIRQIQRGIGSDVRIGREFLRAGLGYGGSCFPKDIKGLIHAGKTYGVPTTFAECVEQINAAQKTFFINKLINFYNNDLNGRVIGFWGVAFKPHTDDLRDAPALDVIHELTVRGARCVVYDPVALENFKHHSFSRGVICAQSAEEVVHQADALVICTEWPEFVTVDSKIFAALRDKVVFDGRNIFDPEELAMQGIAYYAIGRPHMLPGVKMQGTHNQIAE